MKIPKSLKLPRKLKKELKKGITRNFYSSNMQVTHDPLNCVFYNITTYSGSNTKPFRSLLKILRKEEKKKYKMMYEQMAKEAEIQMEFMKGVNWNYPLVQKSF